MFYLECINCGAKYDKLEVVYVCRKCGELLEVKYYYDQIRKRLDESDWDSRPLSVWKFKELLPVRDDSGIVSLNEGGTTLHNCKRLAEKLGLKNFYVKNEGENPTGSFKDRGMTVGITKAVEAGAKTVACASTGNTSASLAAYAAKAGLQCIVLIPSRKIAYGKLAQAIAYGAKVIQVRGNFDQALELARKLSIEHREIYLLNSLNPFRIEGQKTLGFEACVQLDFQPPSHVFVPVGNAGNISAIWKGFKEFKEMGLISATPQMIGIQAEKAAPIAAAIKSGRESIEPWIDPETVATAIRIGRPVSWRKALKAIRESEGTAETVSDEEILNAQRLLARSEGIFVEPASASSIAGLKKLVEAGEVDSSDNVICVTTGHGLKDPDVVVNFSEKPIEIDPTREALEKLVRR